jgi:hypothetical protein
MGKGHKRSQHQSGVKVLISEEDDSRKGAKGAKKKNKSELGVLGVLARE